MNTEAEKNEITPPVEPKPKKIYYSVTIFQDVVKGEQPKQVIEEWVKVRRKDGQIIYKCIKSPFTLPRRCGPIQFIHNIKPTVEAAYLHFAETQRGQAKVHRGYADDFDAEAKKAEDTIKWLNDMKARAAELVEDDVLTGDF